MKILLAGDSTLALQPEAPGVDPGLRYCGWGQMLGRFLNDVPVLNFAVNGYTIDDFRNLGKYDELKQQLNPGDYVFMQFGHNDQKREELRPNGRYRSLLAQTANEIRDLGGIPVFVTSVARNSWRGDNGEYLDLLAPYVAAMKAAAAEVDAPVLDLNCESTAWIKSLGRDGAKRYFYPGDFTHPNDYGAYRWATFLATEILNNSHPDLAKLKRYVKPTDQWEKFDIPAEKADPKTGWLAPPPPNSDFAKWAQQKTEITFADALAMAREANGWFVLGGHPGLTPALQDLACAKENGYLPAGFPETDLDRPIDPESFMGLMKCSAQGRNAHTPQTQAFRVAAGPDDKLTGRAAVDYALALTKL